VNRVRRPLPSATRVPGTGRAGIEANTEEKTVTAVLSYTPAK
jgi:hypothetical protein